MTLSETVINDRKTKNKAKSVLSKYRRLNRMAGVSCVDLKSPIISDMPKAERTSNSVSDNVLKVIDAQRERDDIIKALACLPYDSRLLLFYTYCDINKKSNQFIADELGFAERTLGRNKNEALIEFAEAYKGGELLCFDNSKMA